MTVVCEPVSATRATKKEYSSELGSQNDSKMEPKMVPGTSFFRSSENLVFDDSTMVLHGFSSPGRSGKRPKTDKKMVLEKNRRKVLTF